MRTDGFILRCGIKMSELLVSKQVAEGTLAKYKGDMEKALGELVGGP